jgi:hypothetical protein
MIRDTIWLSIGDEYTTTGYPSDTPCRSGNHLLTLKEAKDHPDFQKDFKVHLGGGSWTPACFSKTQSIRGDIRVEADELPGSQELVDVLSPLLNSEAITEALKAAGVKGLKRIWLRLFPVR